jgi:DNA-binding transcriptional regulator GbsR (MarR family)
MPEKMPTIAEFARTLGVSKSNVVNKIKKLDLETVTKPGDKRRCQYLPERTCSVLADRLAKTKPAVQADETRLLDLYQAQVEPLKSANASLQRQVQLLMDQLDAAEKAAAESARQSQAHIDDLKSQTERLEAENRDLKSQLALSRALEGFHFPWTRDRIKARYLLPGSDSNQ